MHSCSPTRACALGNRKASPPNLPSIHEHPHTHTLSLSLFPSFCGSLAPGRLERSTLRLTASRSSQLSYGSLEYHRCSNRKPTLQAKFVGGRCNCSGMPLALSLWPGCFGSQHFCNCHRWGLRPFRQMLYHDCLVDASCLENITSADKVTGARSVAASYKPPMLVTRVRLPACAYFPCACCSCGVVLVLIPRITAAVDHESQHALDPNQPHQETDIDIRFALHYHLWSPPGTLSTHGLVAMTSA